MHRRLAQDQSVDSTGKVLSSILMSVSLSKQSEIIEVEALRHQQSILPEQWRNSFTSDQSVC